MLAIKLQRIGKKHQPSYRLVVAEKRSKLGAPPVEDLGSYNPAKKALNVKLERVEYWIKNGAQSTVTVHNLLVKNSVIKAARIVVKMKKAEAKPAAVTETKVEEAISTEVPKAEAEPTAEDAVPAVE